ncbi:MAG: undecaprenyl/decaprenyl-phosphate alpha-N-acetylglucosaminyl 1-phosphate transferase [Anaerolineaceae bacterium]|nr:undecaprenyl/decaprenyl-phosphate alpha-N-acetylglucosaminyl 1-phosphate transferase [Anaerolineaceae bacterium]
MGAIGAFILVFSLALSITLILVPVFDRIGRRLGVVASFGGRHVNEADRRQVSKLGGAALFIGFMIAILVAQVLPVERLDPYEVIRFVGLFLGGIVIFAVGLLDDLFNFSSLPLFLGQFLAAGIAIVFQIFIETFNNPLTGQQTNPWPYVVTVALSLFWLVGMMNTVNFLDGLDGLAGGVAFIAGAMLFINSAFIVQPAQTSVSLLFLALMGAAFGFLLHNFNPARIFLGGSAYFLGYILGALSIIGGAKMAAILLVMGLPLMDVAWQAMNRIRQGRSPFVGDRGHIHFRLQDMGFSQRSIVLAYYSFCAVFGVLTLVTESRLFKFTALGIMLALIAVGFVLVARSRRTESPLS